MDVWRGSAVGEFLNGFVAAWNSGGHDGRFLSEEDCCWLKTAGFAQVTSMPLEYVWQAASVMDMSSFMCDLFGLDLQPPLSAFEQAWKQLGYISDEKHLMLVPWSLQAIHARKA
jgi:hypothetical protein